MENHTSSIITVIEIINNIDYTEKGREAIEHILLCTVCNLYAARSTDAERRTSLLHKHLERLIKHLSDQSGD